MAPQLNEAWGVGASQVRYREVGDWYALLNRFPAALFDAHGYIRFDTEEAYRSSQYISIGKQIYIPKPGISVIPGYVRVIDTDTSPGLDVDIHTFAASEGERRLVLHLQRERNQAIVRSKKARAASLNCEICGFSFSSAYGHVARDYCEVHHLLPLSEIESAIETRLEDLAILCGNCHRVVHLHNPPYTLHQVRRMFTK